MPFKKIFSIFLSWRIILFGFLAFAVFNVPLQNNFLGGGIGNYSKNPFFWSWINFDGEHYLSIAKNGYLPLTYFYFPLYPLLIRIISGVFYSSFKTYALSGIMLSNLLFLTGLIGYAKLIELDFSTKVSLYSLILLLIFPASFYFGAYYNESLFFALTVWSFYCLRKDKYICSGVLAGLATATRILGIAIFPAIIFKILFEKGWKKNLYNKIKYIFTLSIAPSGLIIYMIYLKVKTGDFLAFFHSLEIFGQQRATTIVLLPQVFYRYIFKILPNINYDYFPVVLTTYLEFLSGILFGLFLIVAFLSSLGKIKRIKFPWIYTIYFTFAYFIPPLSGSFSSFARYSLVFFPAFVIAGVYLAELSKILKVAIISGNIILLFIATSLFTRGYWFA